MHLSSLVNSDDVLLHFRYKVGQRFGRHFDASVDLGDGKRTYYTLLVYLSGGPGELKSKPKNDSSNPSVSSVDPLVGGETVFYGQRNKTVAEVNYLFSSSEVWVGNISFTLQLSVNFCLMQILECMLWVLIIQY